MDLIMVWEEHLKWVSGKKQVQYYTYEEEE